MLHSDMLPNSRLYAVRPAHAMFKCARIATNKGESGGRIELLCGGDMHPLKALVEVLHILSLPSNCKLFCGD